MKLVRCWACNALIGEVRAEAHHGAGQEISDLTVQLCIICHDTVDRLDARIPQVFSEFSYVALPKDRKLPIVLAQGCTAMVLYLRTTSTGTY